MEMFIKLRIFYLEDKVCV